MRHTEMHGVKLTLASAGIGQQNFDPALILSPLSSAIFLTFVFPFKYCTVPRTFGLLLRFWCNCQLHIQEAGGPWRMNFGRHIVPKGRERTSELVHSRMKQLPRFPTSYTLTHTFDVKRGFCASLTAQHRERSSRQTKRE